MGATIFLFLHACTCGDDGPPDIAPDDCDAIELMRRIDDSEHLSSANRQQIQIGISLAWDRRFAEADAVRLPMAGTNLTTTDQSDAAVVCAYMAFEEWMYGSRTGPATYAEGVKHAARAIVACPRLAMSEPVEEIEAWILATPGFMAKVWSHTGGRFVDHKARHDRWIAVARESACSSRPDVSLGAQPAHEPDLDSVTALREVGRSNQTTIEAADPSESEAPPPSESEAPPPSEESEAPPPSESEAPPPSVHVTVQCSSATACNSKGMREFYRHGLYAEATAYFEEAARRRADYELAMYNAACTRALLGDEEQALDWLRRINELTTEAATSRLVAAQQDPDFDSIRDRPEFIEIVGL